MFSPTSIQLADTAALTAFELLAPGVKPSAQDQKYLALLSVELMNMFPSCLAELSLRLTQDEGFPLLQIFDPDSPRETVDCWIEDLHSPNAFFYWES